MPPESSLSPDAAPPSSTALPGAAAEAEKRALVEDLDDPEAIAKKEAAAKGDDADDDQGSGKKKKKKKKKKYGTKRGVETMFRTSYRVHMDLSSLADTKANIMISINGIIVSIMLASIAPQAASVPKLLIPTTAMILTCLISLVFAVLAARPRVTNRTITLDDVREGGANILFFGNFSNMNREDFEEGMDDLMHDGKLLYFNMMRDIYGLGLVLNKKFRLLRVAYNVFMFGLIISISLFIAIYVWLSVEA